MNIAEKLQTIQNIKEDIKTSINNKGGNVGNDFTQYSTAIDNLNTGGGITKIDVAEYGLKFANSTFVEVPEIFEFSNVTKMDYMFEYCRNLQTFPLIDTSFVIDMSFMFRFCTSLTSISPLNTSNVTDMRYMLYNATNLISLPALNTTKVTSITNYFGTSNFNNLTDVGGWINLNINWNDNNGLVKCPNLTYQSCINILNGLADVTELGGRTLKVHQNFLDTVGDEISIAVAKSWTITA